MAKLEQFWPKCESNSVNRAQTLCDGVDSPRGTQLGRRRGQEKRVICMNLWYELVVMLGISPVVGAEVWKLAHVAI